ncbi:MAG: enoyl-CoA hydratase/isomerase family protein [Burkholderiales bacterium]|nr:enoyl-CoA hydratase/isomerase family protein [Burkholderiales bacterium]
MSQPPVLVSADARGVVRVTLNRPAVNNAYDGAMIDALIDACAQVRAGGAARAVVLAGNGRHFQAGADLGWLDAVRTRGAPANLDASERTARAMWELNTLPVPTVALIHGGCFGGGTGIAAACDVAIAADNAMFAIAETRWGMAATIIFPQLADAIGVRHLRRYAQTGERFGAAEARRIGLVHEVVPAAELEAAGARVVDALLKNAPRANAVTKAGVLRQAWADVHRGHFAAIVAEHAAGRQSAEAAEGLASFHEEREAAWYPRP